MSSMFNAVTRRLAKVQFLWESIKRNPDKKKEAKKVIKDSLNKLIENLENINK